MFDISTFAKEWLPLILTSAIAICSMIFSYEAQLKGIRKDQDKRAAYKRGLLGAYPFIGFDVADEDRKYE